MFRSRWSGVAGTLLAAMVVLMAGSPARAQDMQKWVDDLGRRAIWYQIGSDDQPVEVGGTWIGVLCGLVDEVLAAHLKLEHGLVVERVVPNSPAAKAGLEPHDILLSFGDRKLAQLADLVAAVKAAEDKPAEVKLIRGGKERSLKITPAPRPQGDAGVQLGPAPDRAALGRWFEQFNPERLDRVPLRMQRFRPGVLVPDGEDEEIEVPENLAITITKQGGEPAKITVKRGDESWEATEDTLDKLPEDVRPHVKRYLGKGGAIELELGGDAFKWIPREMRELPQFKRALPVPPVPRVDVPMQQMERRMRQQLQQMRRSLDQMQRELDTLHDTAEQQPATGAEVVPVKPDKADAPKKKKKNP